MQLALAQRRSPPRDARQCPGRPSADGLLAAFDARLPFQLTAGPARGRRAARGSSWPAPHPMHRLLQGEVGSGKTSWRCGRCSRSSTPAARPRCSRRPRCSPQQHHRSIDRSCSARWPQAGQLGGGEHGTRVALLTGSLPARGTPGGAARRRRRRAGIVVGTHALIQEHGAASPTSGLVVVDEQHRFGVEQRDALRGKAPTPAAPAGDDRHPDPAHGGDDGLRRPGHLHPGRTAAGRSPIATHVVPAARVARLPGSAPGSGSARRSPPGGRPTSSAPASATSTRATPTPRRPTSRRRRAMTPDDLAGARRPPRP